MAMAAAGRLRTVGAGSVPPVLRAAAAGLSSPSVGDLERGIKPSQPRHPP